MHVVLIGARPESVSALVDAGHEVTLLYEGWEETRAAPWRGRVARWCVVDSYLIIDSLWGALHHVGATDVDAVVATAEYGIVPGAILGRMLGARSLDPAVAMRCRDKAVQKSAWRAGGVPTADWVVIPDAGACPDSVAKLAAAGVSAPFVVKPTAGSGTQQVRLATDERELTEAVAQCVADDPSLRHLMIEHRNNGPEWHLDGVVQRGELHSILVSRYRAPLIETKSGYPTGSISIPPDMHPDLYQKASDLTLRALRSLELENGVFHFEVFGEPDRFVAGELAARPGGKMIGALVSRVLGVDIWAAAAQVITDDTIERTGTSPGRVYGCTNLPSVAGRINQLRPEHLKSMPGMIDLEIKVPFGATMPDMRDNSGVRLGIALVEAPDEDTCESRLADVVERTREINSTATYGAPRGDVASSLT